MRRCYRRPLPHELAVALHGRAQEVARGADREREWKNFRATASGHALAALLDEAAGRRGRCMYCSDSRAVAVEHYRPQSMYPDLTFVYRNHLLICDNCNRRKLNQFALDPVGAPLLLDPCSSDPWSVLFIDCDSGVITARPHATFGINPVAVETLRVLPTMSGTAVEAGRRASARRLRAGAGSVVAGGMSGFRELADAVADDDYDIASWFLLWEGSREQAFSSLRLQQPRAWRRFAGMACSKRFGLA